MAVYSHSRISSFETCPLKYRYRYIDRIKTDAQGIEAFMGKLVHEVLEEIYTDPDRARASEAGDYARAFSQRWRRRYTPAIRIVREDRTAQDYHDLGVQCVQSFFSRNHPFRDGPVVACEMKIEFSLDAAGRYRMLGFIDRVDRPEPNVIEIHDYKTGRLPRGRALERDRQLTLYEIAVRQKWPEVERVRQVWHFVAHDRRFTQSRDADQLGRTRLATIKAIDDIEACTDFPARTSPLCSWCEYQDICPAWTSERNPQPPPQTAPEASSPPKLEHRTGQFLLF